MGFGSYKGKCASHLSSVQADVTLCLFLSSAQCRFCCVPLPDNALHIQRRQPVGTWGYKTLSSCTGLPISLHSFFSPPFFVRKHCIAIFHCHPLSWLRLALYFGTCTSSACWGFSVRPCAFVWFSTFCFPLSVSPPSNRGALFTGVFSVFLSGDVLFQMAEVHRQIQVQLEEMVGIPSSQGL